MNVNELNEFTINIMSLRDEIANQVKANAREKINKVGVNTLHQVAHALVKQGEDQFTNRLLSRYPTEPWITLAEMVINNSKLLFFYHGKNSLLAHVEIIISGQESSLSQ